MSVAEAVQWAEEHLFDRNSIVLECQVWQEALSRARGEGFAMSDLTDFTRQRSYIRDEQRPGQVTLREVLLREWGNRPDRVMSKNAAMGKAEKQDLTQLRDSSIEATHRDAHGITLHPQLGFRKTSGLMSLF